MDEVEVDLTQEFVSPDINLLILLKEMEDEIKLLQLDLIQIKSPILKGYAQKKYLELKKEYFYLMAEDLKLLKMYESDNEQEEENDI